MSLDNATGVFRCEHGREVEHGDVGLAEVVDGVVEGGQLVVGGEVGRLPRVPQQGLVVHVVLGQQRGHIPVVLTQNGHSVV